MVGVILIAPEPTQTEMPYEDEGTTEAIFNMSSSESDGELLSYIK